MDELLGKMGMPGVGPTKVLDCLKAGWKVTKESRAKMGHVLLAETLKILDAEIAQARKAIHSNLSHNR